MIIKMETSDAISEAWKNSDGSGGSKTVKDSDWRFIDDLKYVESSELNDNEKCAPDDWDEFYISVYGNPMAQNVVNKRVLVKAKRLSNGNDVAVVSERRVYLLNNSGTTIERLN